MMEPWYRQVQFVEDSDRLRCGLARSFQGRYDQIPQLTASQSLPAGQRQFSLTDAIVGNMNPMIGRQFTKKKHPKRPNLLHGGLGDMLAVGAVGFAVVAFAPDMVMGGLALGSVAADAAGAVGGGMLEGVGGLLGGGGLIGGALDLFGGD
mmetsp:Transcript_5764/g.12634  ORF Transcript_5764/g.12634 Transcript_5764/m.12634 type:complete len:150 (-) Transcript_5764:141-590(-)